MMEEERIVFSEEEEDRQRVEDMMRHSRIVIMAYKEIPEAVLEDLSRFCHENHPTYVRGDTHETALREGERNVFLRIKQFRAMDPYSRQHLNEVAVWTGKTDSPTI